MANTTDIIISCYLDREKIKLGGFTFNKISNGSWCSGEKVCCFESYATSKRGMSEELIIRIIEDFYMKLSDISSRATMIIDSDDHEEHNGSHAFDRGY